ncbi:hypothetical protein M408DRAFT_28024 [Serendipita vermifera MAFF 305830]|uniref:Uncharacterized protein n=1 Tax=Serendipita vermifera MAFF 305830 TaxID=933852 RepID=A0A0C3ATJ1_SERVB|nr:hypothetical protein M408DRAFT_28024 [Serendipita vermifera MAFF 305830]
MPLYAIIDDTDPGLVWTGHWELLTEPVFPLAREYNGTTHRTNDSTATVSYQFYGSEIAVFGTIDTPDTREYPNASFSVTPNAVPLIHFNQTGYVPTMQDTNVPTTHVKLFTSDRLTTGNYTMTITADGASPDGAAFYLDYLTIQLPDSFPESVKRVIVDNADPQWGWQGPWEPQSIPGNYLNTIHQTHDPGIYYGLWYSEWAI